MKYIYLILIISFFTSCALVQPPVIKPTPVKSYREKQEEKTYQCLKELIDKVMFTGMKSNLENIAGACKEIYQQECK